MAELSQRFSLNVKRFMELRGYNQKTLAAAAGITEATMSRSLKEKTSPDLATVDAIAKALRVAPGELIEDPERATSVHTLSDCVGAVAAAALGGSVQSGWRAEAFRFLAQLDDMQLGRVMDAAMLLGAAESLSKDPAGDIGGVSKDERAKLRKKS